MQLFKVSFYLKVHDQGSVVYPWQLMGCIDEQQFSLWYCMNLKMTSCWVSISFGNKLKLVGSLMIWRIISNRLDWGNFIGCSIVCELTLVKQS